MWLLIILKWWTTQFLEPKNKVIFDKVSKNPLNGHEMLIYNYNFAADKEPKTYQELSKTSPFGMQQHILTVLRSVTVSGSTGERGRFSFTVMTCEALT